MRMEGDMPPAPTEPAEKTKPNAERGAPGRVGWAYFTGEPKSIHVELVARYAEQVQTGHLLIPARLALESPCRDT